MSESWQDWDSKEYREFLEGFYRDQIELAKTIVKEGSPLDFTPLTIAVFNKIAPPAVYLKAEYEKWKKEDAIPEREPVKQKPKQVVTQWRLSGKNPSIEWCPEQNASEEDVAKAMAKEGGWWYRPAQGNYKYGSIFRKVKP